MCGDHGCSVEDRYGRDKAKQLGICYVGCSKPQITVEKSSLQLNRIILEHYSTRESRRELPMLLSLEGLVVTAIYLADALMHH